MRLLWQFPLNQNSFGSPLVDEDRVLVATRRMLFCLSLEGREIWRLALPGATSATPVKMDESVVLLTTEKGELLFIDRDGCITEKVSLGHGCGCTPVLHDNSIYLALGGTRLGVQGAVTVLDQKGEPMWRREADQGFPVSPLVTEKLVVCRTRDGNVVALDRTDGAVVWEEPLQTSLPATPVEFGPGHLLVNANPLLCVDPHGSELWSKPLPGRNILAVEDTVLVSTYEGPLFRLNANGDTLWQTDDSGYEAPSVADTDVWIGHGRGSLRRLSLRTGQRLSEWQAPPGPRGQKTIPDWGPPVVRDGKLFVVSPHSQILHCLSVTD